MQQQKGSAIEDGGLNSYEAPAGHTRLTKDPDKTNQGDDIKTTGKPSQ